MSEILSREEFERVKEYAEFRARKIKEMGVSDLFEATGGGADVPDWIPTIEALAAALKGRYRDWDDDFFEVVSSGIIESDDEGYELLRLLDEKGWIE